MSNFSDEEVFSLEELINSIIDDFPLLAKKKLIIKIDNLHSGVVKIFANRDHVKTTFMSALKNLYSFFENKMVSINIFIHDLRRKIDKDFIPEFSRLSEYIGVSFLFKSEVSVEKKESNFFYANTLQKENGKMKQSNKTINMSNKNGLMLCLPKYNT